MSGEDFDNLAALWHEEPPPEEQRRLETLVRRVNWRAKAAQKVEIAAGALLLAILAATLWFSPAPATLLTGGAFAAALIWSTWKRYRLNRVALIVETNDRAALLDRAIAGTEVRLRRSRFGVWLLLPGYLLVVMTHYAVMKGNLDRFLPALAAQAAPTTRTGIATIVLVAGAMIYFARSHLRIRDELRNLQDLRAAYQTETRLDAEGIL